MGARVPLLACPAVWWGDASALLDKPAVAPNHRQQKPIIAAGSAAVVGHVDHLAGFQAVGRAQASALAAELIAADAVMRKLLGAAEDPLHLDVPASPRASAWSEAGGGSFRKVASDNSSAIEKTIHRSKRLINPASGSSSTRASQRRRLLRQGWAPGKSKAPGGAAFGRRLHRDEKLQVAEVLFVPGAADQADGIGKPAHQDAEDRGGEGDDEIAGERCPCCRWPGRSAPGPAGSTSPPGPAWARRGWPARGGPSGGQRRFPGRPGTSSRPAGSGGGGPSGGENARCSRPAARHRTPRPRPCRGAARPGIAASAAIARRRSNSSRASPPSVSSVPIMKATRTSSTGNSSAEAIR